MIMKDAWLINLQRCSGVKKTIPQKRDGLRKMFKGHPVKKTLVMRMLVEIGIRKLVHRIP